MSDISKPVLPVIVPMRDDRISAILLRLKEDFDLDFLDWDGGALLNPLPPEEIIGRDGPLSVQELSALGDFRADMFDTNPNILPRISALFFTTDEWVRQNWFERGIAPETNRIVRERLPVWRVHFGDLEYAEAGIDLDPGNYELARADTLFSQVPTPLAFVDTLQTTLDEIKAYSGVIIGTVEFETFTMTEPAPLAEQAKSQSSSKTPEAKPSENTQKRTMNTLRVLSRLVVAPIAIPILVWRAAKAAYLAQVSKPRSRRRILLEIMAFALVPMLCAFGTYNIFTDGAVRELSAETNRHPAFSTPESNVEISRAHDGAITSVDIDDTGRYVASGGLDGMVRLWSSQGEFIDEIAAPFGGVQAVAFLTLPDRDGEFLAIISRPLISHQAGIENKDVSDPFRSREGEPSFVGLGGPENTWAAVSVPKLKPVAHLADDPETETLGLETIAVALIHRGVGALGETTFDATNVGPSIVFEQGFYFVSDEGVEYMDADGRESRALDFRWRTQISHFAVGAHDRAVVITDDGHSMLYQRQPTEAPTKFVHARPLRHRVLDQTVDWSGPVDISDRISSRSQPFESDLGAPRALAQYDFFGENVFLAIWPDGTVRTSVINATESGLSIDLQTEGVVDLSAAPDGSILATTGDGRLLKIDVLSDQYAEFGTAPFPFNDAVLKPNGDAYALYPLSDNADTFNAEDGVYYWQRSTQDDYLDPPNSWEIGQAIVLASEQSGGGVGVLERGKEGFGLSYFRNGTLLRRVELSALRNPTDLVGIGGPGVFAIADQRGVYVVSTVSASLEQSTVAARVALQSATVATSLAYDPASQFLFAFDTTQARMSVFWFNENTQALDLQGVWQLENTAPDARVQVTSPGETLALIDSTWAVRGFSIPDIAAAIQSSRGNEQKGEIVCQNCLAAWFQDPAEGSTFPDDIDAVYAFTVDGQGRMVAWETLDLENPIELEPWELPSRPVFVKKLDLPNRNRAAAVFENGSVLVFDPTSQTHVFHEEGSSLARPTALDASAETELLIVGTATGTLTIFNTERHARNQVIDIGHSLVKQMQ